MKRYTAPDKEINTNLWKAQVGMSWMKLHIQYEVQSYGCLIVQWKKIKIRDLPQIIDHEESFEKVDKERKVQSGKFNNPLIKAIES